VPLADTQAIAILTGRPESTIRSWAHRGLIGRKGTGKRGLALYDIDEAQELARRLGHVDNSADVRQHQERSRTVAP
jgi:hypothetical protein